MEQMNRGSTFVLYLVCMSALFASLSQNIYSPIIPLIKDSFGVSVTMVNISVSIFILITAIMQIVLGFVIDFKEAKSILIPGMILTIIASIGCAITQDFTVFLVCRSLQALGTAAIPLIAATTIGNLFQGSERGKAMGTYQMVLSIAPVVAPVVGGFIGNQYSYPGIFWFITVISVILLWINSLYFPKGQTSKQEPIRIGKALSHYKAIFKSRVGSSILILSFVAFFLYFSMIVYLPIVLTDRYHLSLGIVGLLYLPMAFSTMLGSVFFKYIQVRKPLKSVLLWGNVVMASSVLLFAFTHLFSLVGISISLILHGMAVGILTPLFSTMITNEFEQQKGSAIGMFNFVRYMGMAAGPIISGFLLAFGNSSMIFGSMGVLYLVLGLFMMVRMYANQKRVVECKGNVKRECKKGMRG
ncbi:MFS transporter [Croceifilum oryzae]|nr:MFS transporter [Croceifilum oryzae]